MLQNQQHLLQLQFFAITVVVRHRVRVGLGSVFHHLALKPAGARKQLAHASANQRPAHRGLSWQPWAGIGFVLLDHDVTMIIFARSASAALLHSRRGRVSRECLFRRRPLPSHRPCLHSHLIFGTRRPPPPPLRRRLRTVCLSADLRGRRRRMHAARRLHRELATIARKLKSRNGHCR